MSAAPGGRRHGRALGLLGPLALVALAYVPTLATAPGIVAADTKQYLVLDPGRLLATAASMWDPSQFGGHVTHQQLGYLWPMGPWFWAGHALGLPAWVTQRLWLGTVLVSAGLGMRWLARHLGLSPAAAFVAAATYQLSPYVLAYVNRTSALLLPWAALPTLLVCTMLAVRRPGWRWPAVAGLVAGTAGGLNATAIVLVALGPLLWLWWAAWHGPWARRAVVAAAARLAACGAVTACWWVVGLAVEARYGSDVLAYSETARAVAGTASAAEGLRGLGYWLFYGGGVDGAWNSAARAYLANPALQLLGFALAAAGLAGLVVASGWVTRRWLAVQAFVGLALAAVAFPPDAASPLGRALLGTSGRSTLVLALRSGTRALPLLMLALAAGTGALVELAAARRVRTGWHRLGGALVATVVVAANLPALWTGGFVDAALRRPSEAPAWWRDTAAALGSGNGRVLELAGQEFAAYRWGTTTDPLLPGLVTRPLLTRDLLPLGSADTMDVLYALDDRFQQGRAEPAAVAPVARLLGATDVVARLDAADERYRTPQAGAVLAALTGASGLAAERTFGPVEVRAADPPRVDGRAVADAPVATPAVAVFAVTDAAAPTRVAPVSATIVLAGNGDGVVDAAAAGLIDGTRPLRYGADLGAGEPVAPDTPVIVTDSNRRRARQWRGTQDTLGFTEDGLASSYAADDADARLALFPDASVASETVAVQHGARATASAYGEPNAYRPEDRAAMAADGDPATAWRVGDRADPVGERWRIDLARSQAVPTVRLVQQQLRAANRAISRVVIRSEHVTRAIALDESSYTAPGQTVALGDADTAWVEIEIAATTTGATPSFFGLDAVGFAEIDVGARVDEIVTLPTDVVDRVAAPNAGSRPLAFVLTRERVDPAERWRSDPEPALVRSFRAPSAVQATVVVQARLHQRAGDDVLAALDGPAAPVVHTSSRLAGSAAAAGVAVLDGDPATAWTSAVDDVGGAWWEERFDAPRALARVDVVVVRDVGRRSVPRMLAFTIDDGAPVRADVGDDGRASVDLGGVTGSRLRVTVADAVVTGGVDRRYGEAVALPVGLAEVTIAGVAPVVAPAAIDTGCRDDLVTVDGRPLPLRLRAARADLVDGAAVALEPCGAVGALALASGDHVLRAAPGAHTGIDVDRVVLTSNWIASPVLPLGGVTVRAHGRTSATLAVSPSSEPQWLVWGEGRNDGWHANVDGHDLGRAAGLVGGGNVWRLEPSTEVRTVHVTWRPQRWVNAGLALSALGALACVAAALWPRHRRFRHRRFRHLVSCGHAFAMPNDTRCPNGVDWLAPRERAVAVGATTPVAAVALAIALGLVAHPLYGVGLLVVWLAWRRTGSALAVGWCGPAIVVAIGAYVALRQVVSRPAAGYGWPQALAAAHRPALAAVALVALHALGGATVPQPADAEDHDVGGGHREQRHDGRVEARVAEERPHGHDEPADSGDDHPPARTT